MRRILCLAGSLLLLVSAACASETAAETEDTTAKTGDDLRQQPTLGEEPAGAPTKYPFMFVSGVATSGTFHSFFGVAELYREIGHGSAKPGRGLVTVADLPPFASVQTRGSALAKQIKEALDGYGPSSKINILAHSMGGLDARVAIKLLNEDAKYRHRVASLTTIATPHRGTALADFALSATSHVSEPALNALASYFGKDFSALAGETETDVRTALQSISEQYATTFNKDYPPLDSDGVLYQSWAGVSRYFCSVEYEPDDVVCEGKRYASARVSGCTHGFMAPMAQYFGAVSNDAMVTVESAKFGKFQGCIPADHLDEIGEKAAPTKIGFDHLRFYKSLAFDLAKAGY